MFGDFFPGAAARVCPNRLNRRANPRRTAKLRDMAGGNEVERNFLSGRPATKVAAARRRTLVESRERGTRRKEAAHSCAAGEASANGTGVSRLLQTECAFSLFCFSRSRISVSNCTSAGMGGGGAASSFFFMRASSTFIGFTIKKKMIAALITNWRRALMSKPTSKAQTWRLTLGLPPIAPSNGVTMPVGECLDHRRKRSTDHHADREINHVALENEFLEFVNEIFHAILITKSGLIRQGFSARGPRESAPDWSPSSRNDSASRRRFSLPSCLRSPAQTVGVARSRASSSNAACEGRKPGGASHVLVHQFGRALPVRCATPTQQHSSTDLAEAQRPMRSNPIMALRGARHENRIHSPAPQQRRQFRHSMSKHTSTRELCAFEFPKAIAGRRPAKLLLPRREIEFVLMQDFSAAQIGRAVSHVPSGIRHGQFRAPRPCPDARA